MTETTTETTIDAAIRTILLANSAVKGIVETRIYPKKLPLNCSLPALSIHKPSNPYSRIMGSPRFQISCWSEDFLEVQILAKSVEKALDGFSGIIDGFEIIQIVPLESEDADEETTGLFHIPYDFQVTYRK